jgi:O-antigen/teichoic acid export membrane protein
MLQKLRNIGKQTFVYGLGSILNKMLGFILIPLYYHHIPIEHYGTLVFYETIIVFLAAFLNYGIGPGLQRYFYIEKENGTYGKFLFNNFLGCIILSVASIVPILLFSGDFASAFFGDKGQSLNLQLAMWIVVSDVLFILPLQVLQYEEKPLLYLLYNALKLIASFSFTIFFVVGQSMGIEGILYARLSGGLISLLLVSFVIIVPRCSFIIDFNSLKRTIKFGFPLVISNIGYTLFVVSDRFMLTWLSTSEEVGKYGFGFKIANFINLIFVQTIGMSYFPSVMSNESKTDNVRYYRKMLTYYCFLMAVLILGFLFFYPDLLRIAGKNDKYWEGLKVVPLLGLSFMIMGMNYFLGVGLFLKNQTKYYLIPSFSAAGVNFLLNLWLIPKLGMMGAAYSVVIAQIIYASLLAFLSGKHLKVDFEWVKVFSIYILAIAIFEAGSHLNIKNFFLSIAIKMVMLAIFPVLLYQLNFFEAIEIQRVKEGCFKLLSKIKMLNQ